MLGLGRDLATPTAELAFPYAGFGKSVAILEPLIGRRGWLTCVRLSVRTLETEDHLVFAGVSDDGELLDEAQCRRLFDLPAVVEGSAWRKPSARSRPEDAVLDEIGKRLEQELGETPLFTIRWRLTRVISPLTFRTSGRSVRFAL